MKRWVSSFFQQVCHFPFYFDGAQNSMVPVAKFWGWPMSPIYFFYFVICSTLVFQYNTTHLLNPLCVNLLMEAKNEWLKMGSHEQNKVKMNIFALAKAVLMKRARVQPERTAMSLERICCQTHWASLPHICYSCLLVCLFWFLSRPASLHHGFPSSACCRAGPQFKAPPNSFCELFACLVSACHCQREQHDI